jgi:hypothetical protein
MARISEGCGPLSLGMRLGALTFVQHLLIFSALKNYPQELSHEAYFSA